MKRFFFFFIPLILFQGISAQTTYQDGLYYSSNDFISNNPHVNVSPKNVWLANPNQVKVEVDDGKVYKVGVDLIWGFSKNNTRYVFIDKNIVELPHNEDNFAIVWVDYNAFSGKRVKTLLYSDKALLDVFQHSDSKTPYVFDFSTGNYFILNEKNLIPLLKDNDPELYQEYLGSKLPKKGRVCYFFNRFAKSYKKQVKRS